MGLLSWIIVGGLAGLLAQALTGESSGCIVTVLLGIVGALVGGLLMGLLGFGGVSGLNIWSILVATIGAVVLLVITRVLRRY